jgi:hypothetical protein
MIVLWCAIQTILKNLKRIFEAIEELKN